MEKDRIKLRMEMEAVSKRRTTTRPKSIKQPKSINRSSTKRENPAPGGVLHLAPKPKCEQNSQCSLRPVLYNQKQSNLSFCTTLKSQKYSVFLDYMTLFDSGTHDMFNINCYCYAQRCWLTSCNSCRPVCV